MPPRLEFHVSRTARDRYQFDEVLFSIDGRLIAADFEVARRFVERVYTVSGRRIPASDIYAAGLIEEILHLLIRHYQGVDPGWTGRAIGFLHANLDSRLQELLTRFTIEFPPSAVYRGEESVEDYLGEALGGSDSVPFGDFQSEPGAAAGRSDLQPDRRRERTLEEMLLLRIANSNPALEAYREFFDDAALHGTAYMESIRLLADFFAPRPSVQEGSPGTGETLLEILEAPARASPHSLEGQLRYLLDKWGAVLGADLRQMILRAMDYVREEVIRRAGPAGVPSASSVPDYHGEPEYERYSADVEWMPRLVLIAKNSYIWLEQLSRKYGRWIRTLDQIPDQELDVLAERGFTGLWLIGLWERSRASQRIKQRMGQADAVASAYSLYSYDIALDLGGWQALQNLRLRAGQRGLRLAADMVPNHMGIDSQWVIEHPDWFLSLDRSPYPWYSFQSENLSDDERVGVYIEDHYYNHSDAAVVFQRRDLLTGDARYVYHGNDGTSFAWNDTAQLDYTQAALREAVIQTILHVARNFPIIRFDAAMTLVKKHIERLWFPEPGTGGAIPSRAEHGMTRAQFESAMPNEFWREVVDRVATEVPQTLLLAEAFWLLEGYFVRTLGMHRVYNSAFMHMLRDEDNAKYRQLIRNTLEFDPQILKRYVNFMSNPDEKTAIEQFGTGDKYFGVCTLLATLPGLPMFAHGQIEGLRERYGMEFRVPKSDEALDEGLLRGHEWKVFPLLHHRNVFADVEHFFLFDFYTAAGRVNENVFAYSNRNGDERGLVLYHNKYRDTRGWIRTSAAALDKASGKLVQKSLGEALGLPRAGYAVFRDSATQLEYIRPCGELWEKGLFAELGAYQQHAFLDWRFVTGENWAALSDALGGAGVESVQAKWEELFGSRPSEVAQPEPVARAPKKQRKKAVKKAPGKKTPKARGKTSAKRAVKAKLARKPAPKKPVPAAKKSRTPKPGASKVKKRGRHPTQTGGR